MKEHPVLFNTEMVKAVLDGRKTQTRRPVKPQPPSKTENGTDYTSFQKTTLPVSEGYDLTAFCDNPLYIGKCPYGQVGDRLWVRETWMDISGKSEFCSSLQYAYRASNPEYGTYYKWKPSIHMPRAASRITLEIVDIRIERVQDIIEEDAESEGVDFLRHIPDADESLTAKELFWCLWDSIYKNWDSNPWVWIVEFKRV